MHALQYGIDSVLRLQAPDHVKILDHSEPRGARLSDAAQAVLDALADPLDFPPLHQAAVRGDRIVVAVPQGIPQLAAVLRGIVDALLEGDARPEDITILHDTTSDEIESSTATFSEHLRAQITVVRHDPDDFSTLAYLAASSSARPIYMNRLLCDADVIVPVGVLRLDSAMAYYGVCGSLFPTFSDRLSRQRFDRGEDDDWNLHDQQCRKESIEVAWLIGSLFSLQLVPGGGNSILHVVAGDHRTVARRGQHLYDSAWHYRLNCRPDLVVASISGCNSQQTWENFARGLSAAAQAVAPQGTIVLCTNLAKPPGPALKRLTTLSDEDPLPKRIRRDHSGDGLSANCLADARTQLRLYLMSRLDEDDVEILGMAPVVDAAEVQRLFRRHDACLLLGNAHYAHIDMDD